MNPGISKRVIHSLSRIQKYSSTGSIVGTPSTQATEVNKSMLQNWAQYWKNVYRDYKSVSLDVFSQMKAHPGKSSLKLLALGSLGYCAYENPDEEHYFNELLKNHLRLVLVPTSIRNKNSEEYINKLESYNNLKCLRYQNFGIISVIYTKDFSENLEVYKKQCDYLQPGVMGYLRERIVDVGFLNFWYFMNKNMGDYDVNQGEWENRMSAPTAPIS